MDSPVHNTPTPNSSRKRPRDNETPSQRQKREKAAERQRRKRERDRNVASLGIMAFQPPDDPQQQQQQPQQQQIQHQPHQAEDSQPSSAEFGQELTPEEAARRDRVRAAARERQRKHRQLVKQRKMRDLGIDMGPGEMVQHMEEVPYRVNTDGQFPQVISHQFPPPPHHPPPPVAQGEPPFPQDQPLGQTFASTLLLSFSCAPLLKQHLLRTLNMTNDDLINLEPIIAKAWDHWDQQRRMHYAEQAAQGGGGMPPGPPPPFAVDMTHEHPGGPNAPHPYPPPGASGPGAPGANGDPAQTPNEFRARFHRSLVAPSPFRTYSDAQAAAAASTTPNGASGSGHPPADPIDPHLSGPNGTQSNQGTITPKTEVRS